MVKSVRMVDFFAPSWSLYRKFFVHHSPPLRKSWERPTVECRVRVSECVDWGRVDERLECLILTGPANCKVITQLSRFVL